MKREYKSFLPDPDNSSKKHQKHFEDWSAQHIAAYRVQLNLYKELHKRDARSRRLNNKLNHIYRDILSPMESYGTIFTPRSEYPHIR